MEIITYNGYDPIEEGQTGLKVSETINAALQNVYGRVRYDFEQADGGEENSIVYIHGKNTTNIVAKLYDANWKEQSILGLFQLIDGNSWSINWHTPLTELYHLLIDYKP